MKQTHSPRNSTLEFDNKLFRLMTRRKYFSREDLAKYFDSENNQSFHAKIDYRLRVIRNCGAAVVIYNRTFNRFEVLDIKPEKYKFERT